MQGRTTSAWPRGRWLAITAAALLLACAVVLAYRVLGTGDPGDTATDDAGTQQPTAETEDAVESSDPAASTRGPDVSGSAGTSEDRTTATAEPEPTQTQAAGGEPEPDGPDGAISGQVASDTLKTVLENQGRLLETPEATTGAPPLVTGAYASALEAQRAEFADMGWTQVGTPRVISLDILEEHPEETPPRAVIRACVDSSDVDILDENGDSLKNEGTPSRSASLYTLVQTDGTWSVDETTFAEDPDC